MNVGDKFTVFDGLGTEFPAELLRVSSDQAEVRLGEPRVVALPPTSITLIQAIAKGDRMDLIIQKTTELGVAAIVPVLTSRVVVKLDAKTAQAKQQRWQSIAQEAARQCGRADVPTVSVPCTLPSGLAQLVPGRRFSLWEEGDGRPLIACLKDLGSEDRSLQLFVGPEGGLSEEEIATAKTFEFSPVTLGPRILRTETAAIVAVALAQGATGGLQ
jgi:16S rRNA (uracil1498-N3)-methyltransferase